MTKKSHMPVELSELTRDQIVRKKYGPYYFGYEQAAIDILEKKKRCRCRFRSLRAVARGLGPVARFWIIAPRCRSAPKPSLPLQKISRRCRSRRHCESEDEEDQTAAANQAIQKDRGVSHGCT